MGKAKETAKRIAPFVLIPVGLMTDYAVSRACARLGIPYTPVRLFGAGAGAIGLYHWSESRFLKTGHRASFAVVGGLAGLMLPFTAGASVPLLFPKSRKKIGEWIAKNWLNVIADYRARRDLRRFGRRIGINRFRRPKNTRTPRR